MSDSRAIAKGLRVLELGSGLASALAGMVLADYGAEVIKLEPPSGDPNRSEPAFLMWNRGKQSLVADLSQPPDIERIQELAGGADVVLSTWLPGQAEGLGLDYNSLESRNPRVIVCSITGFGPSGPYAHYPAHEGVVVAKAGRMLEFACMRGGERPAYSAVPIATYAASQLALHGVLAALYERERSGHGQRVETSLVQALTAYELVNWLPSVPTSLRLHDIPYLPYFVGCTSDGIWLQFAQLSRRQFSALLRNLEQMEVYQDPRFKTAPVLTDPEHMRALRAILLERLHQKTYAEWTAIFEQDPDIAVERLRTTAEAFDHPQVEHNVLIEVDDPRVGPTRQLAPLVAFEKTPAPAPRPAPELGSQSEAKWRSPASSTPAAAAKPVADPSRVLDGVLVLELATWIAAPFGATLLADLGARVIKIEPLNGEPFRQVMKGLPSTKTVMGKESLAIDLKTPPAREIVHKLAARADILIHNYRPGVPERLGIDYATLRELNPRLIYLYGASYGSTGPCATKPAYHPTAGAVCGGALAQAGAGMPPPPGTALDAKLLARISRHLELANETNPDPSAAVAAATGMLLALYHRERTGEGQALETSMLRSNAYTNSADFIDYKKRPPRRRADPELRGLGALYQLYPARDGWVFLACPYPEDFERLCRALDRSEWLGDVRFRDGASRRRNEAQLAQELAALFSERDADELESELTRQGVGCARADRGPFGTFMYEEPSMTEQGFVVKVQSELWGEHRRFGPSVNLSRDSGEVRGSGTAGRETRQILRELGYTYAAIADLGRRGVVRGPDL